MSSKRTEHVKHIDKLCKSGKHHFKKSEVERLLSMYNKLVEGTTNHKLERVKFRGLLHNDFNMTDDMIMDRVFRTFDKDNDNYISKDEWVHGLSVFLRGTLEEKINYTFMTYDLNHDGYISREEIFQFLKASVVKQPTEEDPDESTKELVELCLKSMDIDRDGRISMDDYKKAVKDDPLLLEAFGPCLPKAKMCKNFETFFSDEHCLRKSEVERLLSMYNKYVEGTPNHKLERLKFRDILHNEFGMTDDMLMDRVFRAFDKDSDNFISRDEWVHGLSVFLRGGVDEQIKYAFVVYDLNQDGYISREEMYQLLKTCLVKQQSEEDPDEGIKDLVEICLKKMDLDHDSRLSAQDFENAIKEEPLLNEAFGECLPGPKHCQCFLNLLSDEYCHKY